MITLHCRSSWSLLAAHPYDLTVIKPISITQWTCLPWCVHPPRWSQTRASSWGETWIADFLTWRFISHSLKLVWFKAVLWGCCFCSHVEAHGKVFCSIMPAMSWEKRGDYFLEVLFIPPCMAALRSYWWPDRNMSVFAGNGCTNPSWKAMSGALVQAGTMLK